MSFSHVLTKILLAGSKTDLVTWLATVTAIAYVLLALKENIWCWSFGIISSGLSIYIYYDQSLSYEALLNVFYVALGIYGWAKWKSRSKSVGIEIRRIPSGSRLVLVLIGLLSGLLLGYLSVQFQLSTLPYSDAMITTYSLLATWMTAKKYIENWILWIVVDACAAILYFYKGPELYLFGSLFIFYTVMALIGYYTWKKKLK